ncbi:amino acid adenylation domain-containing protein [Actinokineospora guangxiensis]|uniref:Amino acid adenylation domain-containing protein n=1 Tax=Actinokineospora guangxiensis TaxID=1490288 RepID=A0ABW0EK78_9PSEU
MSTVTQQDTTRPFGPPGDRRYRPPTLAEAVAARAAETPEATAVECDGVVLTHAELDARAARLAGALAAGGIGPGTVVAVAVPRSVELVVALLGVVRAGAAYLPLDPDYPAERTAHMVEVGEPALILDTDRVRALAEDGPPLASCPARPDDAAYVMFTSGTTNKPKGVVITHRAIANRLAAVQEHYRLGERDRVLQKTPTGFDPSVVEVFLTLAAGATLVVARPGGHRDPAYLAVTVRAERITMIRFVASMIPLFLDEYLRDGPRGPLRLMASEGEGLPVAVADRFRAALGASATLITEYGPTEAAVGVTCLACGPREGTGLMPLGPTTPGAGIRVLDADLRPLPPGEAGELYLTGPQLAAGYLGRPAETAARFVADPHGAPGERMYRTGDLGRTRPDGDIDFLGRVDDQVKVRGHRVELGEVSGALLTHPGVEQAAAVVRTGPSGEAALVAFAVGTAAPAALAAHCARTLPAHMVPAHVVMVEALPLTPNGKLDRRALPEPADRAPQGPPPRTAAEETLCALFTEVLGVAPIGVHDDFFALGGTSLGAARLVARLRAATGAAVPAPAVFAAPTVAALAGVLARAGTARPGPAARPRPARPALSPAQQRLWFAQQWEGGAAHAVPTAWRLRGDLDVAALALALSDVVKRHEPLRTVYPVHEGVPYQRVLDECPALAVSDCPPGEVGGRLRELAATPFDLAAQPPIRAHLLATGPNEHVLLVVVHHIATDGWSATPLRRDLATAYAARRAGTAPEFAPLPVAYLDHAGWAAEQLASTEEDLLAHWAAVLDGLPAEIPLPADRDTRAPGARPGGTVDLDLDADAVAALVELARGERATPFTALHALVAALLSRLGGGTDVPIGGIVAGRDDEAVADLVGYFAGTVVLRTDLAGRPTFRELLGRARAVGLAMHAHRDLPFDRLVAHLRPERAPGRHPLCQTVLVLQPDAGPAADFAGLDCADVAVETGAATVDLTFDFAETAAGPRGVLRYAADRFDRGTAEALAARLRALLAQAVADPDRPVDDLDVLLAGEAEPLGVPRPVPAESTVHGLVSATAARTPDAPAVVFGDTTLTYRGLDSAADRLAHRLVAAGARRGDVVGVHLPRSERLVIALLAVLKAGAAYTVLDLAFPAARLRSVLAVAGARLVVAEADATDLGLPVVPVGDVLDDGTAVAGPPPVAVGAEDAACLIFTSGSTGAPKGVLAPHRALIGSLVDQDYCGFGPGDAVVQSAPVSWDAFARQIFGPLLGGGTVLPQPGQRPDPAAIAAVAARHGATVLDAAGSLFTHLCDEHPAAFAGRSWALTGGEPASAAHLAGLLGKHPGLRVVNGYGPVESMGYSTAFHAADGWSGAAVPIGRPVAGKTAVVLDERLRVVPPNVAGELYLAGVGLAHGYAGAAGMTAERFVADPSGPPGARMYRTGDLARRTADGLLECLGRTDEQVKVRGFRVEPEETRAALLGLPGVRQAAVVVREDRPGDRRLVGYVVGAGLDGDRVRYEAACLLPDHLAPAAVVVLDALPRTPNGKLDRRALPAPSVAASTGRPPATEAETVLCGLFADLLGLAAAQVGADDDFFRLGGHSLLVMRLLGRVRRDLGAELTVATVFEAPTPAALADRLATAPKARPALLARTRLKETL